MGYGKDFACAHGAYSMQLFPLMANVSQNRLEINTFLTMGRIRLQTWLNTRSIRMLRGTNPDS